MKATAGLGGCAKVCRETLNRAATSVTVSPSEQLTAPAFSQVVGRVGLEPTTQGL